MAAGRTFRPGPRVEYKQPAHRFTDDTLNTVEIESPLDVAYAPGGAQWRANCNAALRRPSLRAEYRQKPLRFDDDTLSTTPVGGTITVTQDDDVAAVTGTFTDPAYGDGGIRARQNAPAYWRLASRVPYIRRIYNLPADTTIVGTIVVTQDDDVAAIAGTFTDPPYLPDGGIRTRAQSTVFRRLASRIPFLRRPVPVPDIPAVTGVITVTQDDDSTAIAGQADSPYIGDGGTRQRHLLAQGHRRRPQYCQRRYTIDVGTAVVYTILIDGIDSWTEPQPDTWVEPNLETWYEPKAVT